MGVAQLAVWLAAWSLRQSNLPSAARSPTPAREVKPMIVLTPCTSAAMQEEYPASSLNSLLVHTTLPVILSSATIEAPLPPGVTIRLLPSTKGDSLMSQFGFSPPNSF